jgi:hypothetical protein
MPSTETARQLFNQMTHALQEALKGVAHRVETESTKNRATLRNTDD